MKNIFSQFFESLFGSDKAWWIEVKTGEPVCTYYFGPFSEEQEAEKAKQGYVEDLEAEGAKQVSAAAEYRSEPDQLTIYDDKIDSPAPEPKPAYSGQS
jgi:hypothetical protein